MTINEAFLIQSFVAQSMGEIQLRLMTTSASLAGNQVSVAWLVEGINIENLQ